MSLLNPVERGRIQAPDGTEHDLSALWDLHVLVSEPEDLIYLRLSDAHADDGLAVIYTAAVEAGAEFRFTDTAPIAAGAFESGPWVPLEEGHFRFGLAADCLRLSSARITDRRGLVAILAAALPDYLSKTHRLAGLLLGLDAAGHIAAYVSGTNARSAMPQHTIDGSQPAGQGVSPVSLPAALQGLKTKIAGARPPKTPTPASPGVPSSGTSGTTSAGGSSSGSVPRRPGGRTQPAGKSPATTPFRPGSRPFKGPLKNWF